MPAPDTRPPTAQEDLALLCRAAEHAGEIALQFFRRNPKTWEKPGAGPVTEADYAVNTYLAETLQAARPDYGWLSEETPDSTDRLARDTVFIIDPIDGTRSFLEGSGSWAHSLAVAHRGQVIAGAVHMPQRGFTFTASLGGGARLNGAPLTASPRTALDGATLLANKFSVAPKYWPNGLPPIKRHYRPSLAYRLGLVAEGRFDAMLVFRDTWEWDIAAGSLIATEAGASVSDRHGHALRFNTEHPVSSGLIAGGPSIHDALMHQLR
ncbi:inositol monophosphatase family protein [Fluviibacterium sp. S390]|uniref:inositol monophosphatase family protein n=1 Tax=Fluviibacterium sp. S390 TaxID=3415139 RepID=UPI003C79F160